ncbi:MAG: hypothetical protein ACFFBV_03535 [Promethearchaeota archaeon]
MLRYSNDAAKKLAQNCQRACRIEALRCRQGRLFFEHAGLIHAINVHNMPVGQQKPVLPSNISRNVTNQVKHGSRRVQLCSIHPSKEKAMLVTEHGHFPRCRYTYSRTVMPMFAPVFP